MEFTELVVGGFLLFLAGLFVFGLFSRHRNGAMALLIVGLLAIAINALKSLPSDECEAADSKGHLSIFNCQRP